MSLTRGVPTSQAKILSVRVLSREDLPLLREKRPPGIVQRLSDPHHRLARLLASGIRRWEAAERSGYSLARVTMLCEDPSFQNLVEHYRKEVTAIWAENIDTYYELATSNMVKAERQIAEKLEAAETEGEALPTRDLIAISRDAADRFGYGKKQTNLNVNVDFAAQLEKAIKRSGKTIEGVRALSTSPLDAPARVPLRQSPEPLRRRA